jgi:hypothetical protein
MTSAPPPSRYKVVEKEGRLITVDTWASDKADVLEAKVSTIAGPARGTRGPDQASIGQSPRQEATGPLGSFTLTTRTSYDEKGPRDVVVSISALLWWVLVHHIRVVIFVVIGVLLFSWLIWLAPLLFIPAVRQAVLSPFRSNLTKMFDSLAPTAD